MKMTKKLVLAAVVLPLTLGTASAFAFGGKGHHKGMGGECGGFDRGIMRQLDLTDEQQAQLKEMRETNRAAMKARFSENADARRAEMQAYHNNVQALILAENFDQAAANELAKQMVDKQTERKVKMMEKKHQMLSILTPEQKAKFIELKQDRMKECGDKMHKRWQKDS